MKSASRSSAGRSSSAPRKSADQFRFAHLADAAEDALESSEGKLRKTGARLARMIVAFDSIIPHPPTHNNRGTITNPLGGRGPGRHRTPRGIMGRKRVSPFPKNP